MTIANRRAVCDGWVAGTSVSLSPLLCLSVSHSSSAWRRLSGAASLHTSSTARRTKKKRRSRISTTRAPPPLAPLTSSLRSVDDDNRAERSTGAAYTDEGGRGQGQRRRPSSEGRVNVGRGAWLC